jgi:hypothetical protein
MVPPKDDTPVTYKPPKVVVTTTVRRPPPKKDDPKPAVEALPARITAINVVNNKTQITIGRGTANDAKDGMKVVLKGLGAFPLQECTDRRCKAIVSGTPEQVRSAGETVNVVP